MNRSIDYRLPALLVAATLAMSTAAQAAESESYVSAMNYVSIDAQGDSADSRQYAGTGSFALGRHSWLQGTLGKLDDGSANNLGDLTNFGIGSGFKSQHWQFTLDFSQYKNDGSYKQREVTASLAFVQPRFQIAVDALHRKTDNALDTVRNFPTLGVNVALHVDEALTGNGFGAHANFNITDAFTLSLGGISYSYDSSYSLTSSTNPILVGRLLNKFPTLSQLVYLNNSGVTRSLALLDSSYNAGLSYQFSSAALSATYLHDKALDTGEGTDTVALDASVLLGDHWVVTPNLGRSKSEQADSITFGGLSVSYNW